MKLKKIESILKRRKTIVLIEGTPQWIGDYQAMYIMENLPRMDEIGLFAMFDIPKDQQSKFSVIKKHCHAHRLMAEDHCITDNEVSYCPGLGIYCDGSVYLPIGTSQGVKFLAAEYLAPFAKENITLYERVLDGHLVFVVKAGLFIKAVINPLVFADGGGVVKAFASSLSEQMQDYTNDLYFFTDKEGKHENL